MRLSDVSGDRVFDVISEIMEPVANIASNEAVIKMLDTSDGEEMFLKRLVKAVPRLLKDNRSDVVRILAAIDGTTPKEYEATLTMPKLFKDVHDVLTDEDLLAFLSPTASNAQEG